MFGWFSRFINSISALKKLNEGTEDKEGKRERGRESKRGERGRGELLCRETKISRYIMRIQYHTVSNKRSSN